MFNVRTFNGRAKVEQIILKIKNVKLCKEHKILLSSWNVTEQFSTLFSFLFFSVPLFRWVFTLSPTLSEGSECRQKQTCASYWMKTEFLCSAFSVYLRSFECKHEKRPVVKKKKIVETDNKNNLLRGLSQICAINFDPQKKQQW